MTAAPATPSRNLLIVIVQSLKRLEPLKRLERLEPACELHDLAQDRFRESFDELR